MRPGALRRRFAGCAAFFGQKLRRPDSVKNHGRRSSPPPELPTDANIGPLVACVKQSSVIFGNVAFRVLRGCHLRLPWSSFCQWRKAHVGLLAPVQPNSISAAASSSPHVRNSTSPSPPTSAATRLRARSAAASDTVNRSTEGPAPLSATPAMPSFPPEAKAAAAKGKPPPETAGGCGPASPARSRPLSAWQTLQSATPLSVR